MFLYSPASSVSASPRFNIHQPHATATVQPVTNPRVFRPPSVCVIVAMGFGGKIAIMRPKRRPVNPQYNVLSPVDAEKYVYMYIYIIIIIRRDVVY